MPRDVLVARPRAEEVKSAADVRDLVPPMLRHFNSPHDAVPRTHLLSNGRYAVMVTAAGAGYSRWGDIAVTRWREDTTRDSWGSFIYVRDMHTGAVRSAGHQPTGVEADTYQVTYSEDHAEFSRRDGAIVTSSTIVVSTEHDAEIRRVSLTNLSSHEREIELTSYAEIVLAHTGGRRCSSGLPEPLRADRVRPVHRCSPGDASTQIPRREADLGCARCGGRGATKRGRPVRNGPQPLPRSGQLGPLTSVGDRWASSVEHRRSGAGPDLQPSLPRQARTRRHRSCHLLHSRRRIARGGAGPGRQPSRAGDVRTGGDPGMDPGPGSAPSPGDHVRRGPPLPTTRQPHPLLRPDRCDRVQPADQQPAGRARAVGTRDLRRSAHRRRADRRVRGSRHRPAAAPRSRVLADEAPRRRSGDHQRARRHIRAEPPRVARVTRAHQPIRIGNEGDHDTRRRVHPARRAPFRRGSNARAGRCSGRAVEPPGQPCRTGRAS